MESVPYEVTTLSCNTELRWIGWKRISEKEELVGSGLSGEENVEQ